MSDIKSVLSEENPIKRFVKSGFCKYRPGFAWERNCENDSFYYINSGKIKFTLENDEFIAQSGDVILLAKNDKATLENAIGEESSSLAKKFCSNSTAMPEAWSDATQIVTSAIPTHPASGTRFVKNAILILSAPFQNDRWQKIRIGDTVYITNGYVALSDE